MQMDLFFSGTPEEFEAEIQAGRIQKKEMGFDITIESELPTTKVAGFLETTQHKKELWATLFLHSPVYRQRVQRLFPAFRR